jgi:hypothetical protein
MTGTLDRPRAPTTTDEPSVETETETKPQRTKRWRKLGLPWPRGRTRNGAPFEDDPLVIDNQTDAFWALHLGFRELGTAEPRSERREHVVRTGILTARIVGAPTGTGYLTAHLGPDVERVEIMVEKEGSVPEYALRTLERDPSARRKR